MSGFPNVRLRRLRRTGVLRELVRETELRSSDLIYPLFVSETEAGRSAIPSMPGVERLSVAELAREAALAWEEGIRAVLLFGIPAERDETASAAVAADGVVQTAVRELKGSLPDLVVITDVCLCEYTSHGHCGLVHEGEVVNDPTLELLAAQAVSHAAAGADIVAPSDMMDGRVGAVRSALDEAGFEATVILSYAVKYASAFYGPFRDAVDSAPRFGDRRGYQMDPGNVLEALREAALDVEEGADILMVKPALPYLDVLCRVKEAIGTPMAAYHVSGEYAMLQAAAERGWIDGDAAMLEAALAIRRAGADLVITYGARTLARRLV